MPEAKVVLPVCNFVCFFVRCILVSLRAQILIMVSSFKNSHSLLSSYDVCKGTEKIS